MRTLSNVDLEQVTGGKTASPIAATNNNGSGTGNSNGDQALLTAIQGISNTLKTLNDDKNKGLFGGQTGILLLAVLMSQRRSGGYEVHVGRRGYSYQYYT